MGLFWILNVASGNISPRTHTSNISIAARRKVSAPLHRPDDKSWHPALAQNGPAKMTIMAPRVCNNTDCGKPLMKLRLNNCSTVTGYWIHHPAIVLWQALDEAPPQQLQYPRREHDTERQFLDRPGRGRGRADERGAAPGECGTAPGECRTAVDVAKYKEYVRPLASGPRAIPSPPVPSLLAQRGSPAQQPINSVSSAETSDEAPWNNTRTRS